MSFSDLLVTKENRKASFAFVAGWALVSVLVLELLTRHQLVSRRGLIRRLHQDSGIITDLEPISARLLPNLKHVGLLDSIVREGFNDSGRRRVCLALDGPREPCVPGSIPLGCLLFLASLCLVGAVPLLLHGDARGNSGGVRPARGGMGWDFCRSRCRGRWCR